MLSDQTCWHWDCVACRVFFCTSSIEKFLQARHVFSQYGYVLEHFPTHTSPYTENYSEGKQSLLRVAIEQIRKEVGHNSIFFVEDTSLHIDVLSGTEHDVPGLEVKEWFEINHLRETKCRAPL